MLVLVLLKSTTVFSLLNDVSSTVVVVVVVVDSLPWYALCTKTLHSILGYLQYNSFNSIHPIDDVREHDRIPSRYHLYYTSYRMNYHGSVPL